MLFNLLNFKIKADGNIFKNYLELLPTSLSWLWGKSWWSFFLYFLGVNA